MTLTARELPRTSHVVDAKDHILGRHDDRLAVRRAEDVVGGHHQDPGLHLCFHRQRHVDRHLITVEVRVECGANQRVKLDRFALDQHRFKGLHSQPVQGRRAVEDHRVFPDHFLENVPYLRAILFHHLLRALDVGDVSLLFELVVDERLEQLERHDLRQAALVQLQLRPDHDHRSSRVVDSFAEQVLAEAPLLALEHVGKRLQRPLVGAGDGLATAAVVEQRVDRFLKHSLLVANDDVGRVELLQPLQAVVAVDHPAVQVIEIGGREAADVQRNQGPKIRWNHRDYVQHHPLRLVSGGPEGLHHLQALCVFLALGLRVGLAHVLSQLLRQLLHVHGAEHLANRLAAHTSDEALVPVLLEHPLQLLLRDQLPLRQRSALRIDHDIAFTIENLLQILERDVEKVADSRRQRLEKPDVRDRGGQGDVPEPLPADFGLNHLDAALLAHHAAMLHPLVLAAVALIVLHRSEDSGAEQPVPLRLEGAVVNRLRLLHLSVRPLANLIRRRQGHPDGSEGERILGFFEKIENVLHMTSKTLKFVYASVPVLALGSSVFSTTPPSPADDRCRSGGACSSNSTSSARDCSSLSRTLNDSGSPDSSTLSPFTIASYIRVLPTTSSDLTVKNSLSE